MDGQHDHTDSDSSDSWTIVDNQPIFADDVPEFPETNDNFSHGESAEQSDKDEDTDGISVISDSDAETASFEQLITEDKDTREDRPTETCINENFSAFSPTFNKPTENYESIKDDIFLGDNSAKLRTYVHRRNKRLSTVLNIIMLGSVITAAGVAIGHMWGVRDDCAAQNTQSLNKILSNLYKLQEENTYLRTKLKELTLGSNIQTQIRKPELQKPSKQQKCNKVFEEPLNNNNANAVTKCIDSSSTDKVLEGHLDKPDFERDFINDLNKLKNVYEKNKSWLDGDINMRLKREEKKIKKQIRASRKLKDTDKKILIPDSHQESIQRQNNQSHKMESSDRKITYADSLKAANESDNKLVPVHTIDNINNVTHSISKKRPKREISTILEMSSSEEDLKKDDRKLGVKYYKPDRKKHDRQKLYKKQKRRNKYEQWELKGGYIKDYDDLSFTSQDNGYLLRKVGKKPVNKELDKTNLVQYHQEEPLVLTVPPDNVICQNKPTEAAKTTKNDSWYEKRAAIRAEARKKLEKELFGENTSNAAAWYFRRMKKREQCRLKIDNNTKNKKPITNTMNYKVKH